MRIGSTILLAALILFPLAAPPAGAVDSGSDSSVGPLVRTTAGLKAQPEPVSEPKYAARQPDNSAALHVVAGAAGALLVSAVAYPLIDMETDRHSALLVAGLGVGGAMVAGAAKELWDLFGRGDVQLSDFLLTTAGGILAATLVYTVSANQAGGQDGDLGIAAVYASFALILSLPVGENLYRRSIPSSESRW